MEAIRQMIRNAETELKDIFAAIDENEEYRTRQVL